jgi:hypothetical protein
VRSVAYSADAKIAVIYDWATSDTPRRWELNFNALTPIAITDGGAKVVNADASACIDIHGPQGRFTTHRGFAVPPENGAPDQFQARFEAANPSDEWVAVTVIREDCSDVAVTVEVSGSRAVVRIGGKRELDFNQRHVGLFQYPL